MNILFGCAGFSIVKNEGFDFVEDGVSEFLDVGGEILVICSSDKEYKTYVPEICKKVKEKYPEQIITVAGNPKEDAKLLRNSGIDNFIHSKSNLAEVIAIYQKILGIGVGKEFLKI